MGTSATYIVSEILQREVSLFSSVFSREAKSYTLDSMLKSFASSHYAKTIREARGYLRGGDEEMYKACKSMLPVIAFCGLFQGGHSKPNLVRYNNIVIIDIDHLSEESLSTVAQQLQQDEYVFAYWKSPSGQGLKGLVRISETTDQNHLDEHHRLAFRQLTDHLRTRYSIDIDQLGSDYSRLCYACWDVDLVIKESAKVFEVNNLGVERGKRYLEGGLNTLKKKEDAVKKVESEAGAPQTATANQATTRKGRNRQADIDTVRDIIRHLRNTGRSITHEYENWVRVAYAIAATFTSKTGEPLFLLLSQQDADKFDPDACRQLLGYCYDHNNGQVSLGTIVYLAQKEGYRKVIPFEEMAASDFLDAILTADRRADEAVYYLLHERLVRQLKGKFEVYESHLLDGFEDVLEDFFLYLREGKEGRSRIPYPSLHRIRKRESFEAWVLSTFRNYLTMRAAKEDNRTIRFSDEKMNGFSNEKMNGQSDDRTIGLSDYPNIRMSKYPNIQTSEHQDFLTDERKLAITAHLIAFAHQVFYPRSRFIFLRSLLTMLNKKQAMPNDVMAHALGMTEMSYRVSVHRIKCRLAKYRTLLLQGEYLSLDPSHRQMAQRIHDDFTHLYPTLMLYYGQTLDTLSRADDVMRLRQEYLDATGDLLHEAQAPYSLAPSVSAFWTRLERFLTM